MKICDTTGRHPNVYTIPYERCPACQGGNPQVDLPDDALPDETNPTVEDPQPAREPETLNAPTRNACPANPKVPLPQPETFTPPTRNSGGTNPKLREPFASVLARIELRKDVKEVKEKKEGVTRNSFEIGLGKPERQSPYWCEAHSFCHGERLPDHRPDCAQER